MILQSALLASLLALDGEVPPRDGDTVTAYTVQPGDTLESLSQKYLGEPSLWPEYQRLNPQVSDPRRLRIGSTLRVITARQPVSRSAQVVLVMKRVEEKPWTVDWRPSREGNVLREKEGLRTGKDSSSTLQFDDGTRMSLGEDSLVFLREATSTIRGRKKQALEVISGQADLKSRLAPNSRRSDTEVLVGQAVVRPTTDASGEGAVRARRGEGGAEVMVFKGASQVEAAGVTVAVQQGMGTAIPKGQAPKSPEKLLAQPKLESPPANAKSAYANPGLDWSPVQGAVSYTAEVCADATCEKLVLRATKLAAPRYQVPRLKKGTYYWRAIAVSASGLDGFPAPTSSLEITTDAIDPAPPVVMAQIYAGWLLGRDNAPKSSTGTWVVIEARDAVSGLRELHSRWNGGGWQVTPAAAMSTCEDRCLLGRLFSRIVLSPMPPGGAVHALDFRAVDVAGLTSAVTTLYFQNGGLIDPARAGKPRP